jgi:DNA G:T-mismatch repair endonuclease
VLTKHHIAIFVHGCFWHGHGCNLSHIPNSNQDFWRAKLRRTREIDKVARRKLALDDWRVLIIWECVVNPRVGCQLSEVVDCIENWFVSGGLYAEMSSTAKQLTWRETPAQYQSSTVRRTGRR